MTKDELDALLDRMGLVEDWSTYYGSDEQDLPPALKVLNTWLYGGLEEFFNLYYDKDYRLTNWIDTFGQIGFYYQNEDGKYESKPNFPKPAIQPYGVSSFGAENLVRDWMKHLGFSDAHTTQYRRDQGVDVETKEFDIQVKNWHSDFIPVSAIREIYGVAVSREKKPIFFSHSEYSFDSLEFAEKVEMPLFRFKPETSEIISCNQYAAGLLARSNSHFRDIASLEKDWNFYVDAENEVRVFLDLLFMLLSGSNIPKYVEFSEKIKIPIDFDDPIFQHDETRCQKIPSEECLEEACSQFKAIDVHRGVSGPILEILLEAVESEVFRE